MDNTLIVEYGQRIDKHPEDFIKSSNGTWNKDIKLMDLKSVDRVEIYAKEEVKFSDTFLTMLASEKVLAKEWLTLEEDKTWEHL